MDVEENDDEMIPSAPWYIWLTLVMIAMISFWSQATVTEERFVPALNVVALEWHIPSDIAGATLMAVGASSPELFSSFVSLFVTHSALGLGTIVGSEIFNQLVICAGAVYASRNGHLQLDKTIVVREVGFYGLAILLLYVALRNRHPEDDADPLEKDHIFISFGDALLLVVGYLAYVAVCAKMDLIVALCTDSRCCGGSDTTITAQSSLAGNDAKASNGAVPVPGQAERSHFDDMTPMKFMRPAFDHEPAVNFAVNNEETWHRGQLQPNKGGVEGQAF